MSGNAKMSLRSPDEWHGHSTMNMTHATNAHLKANQTCDISRRTHEDCLNENLNAYNDLHNSLQCKVKASQNLIQTLENRARSVQKTIDTTKHSLAKLEAARRAKDGPLQLCTWRMEQRDKRPLQELVRDNAELALEEERHQLLDCQRRLTDSEKRTKQTILNLEDVLKELHADISDKKQALNIDDTCLRTTHRQWQTAVDRGVPGSFGMSMPLTQRSSCHKKTSAEESGRNEYDRHSIGSQHNQMALRKEQDAQELQNDNQRLIDHTQKVADQAAARSEARLQDRVNENQKMRRRLEDQLRETNDKIEHTKATMSQTKSEIKALEEPMSLVSARDCARKQRALREQILDPVSTMLEDHKLSLLRTNESLRNQRQQEKHTLQELIQNRDRLRDDLRDKTAALHIDLNCLSNEALHWNSSPTSTNISRQKFKNSMGIDMNFTPMGGSTRLVPLSPCSPR